jgi:glycine cleavage system H protein
MEGFTYHNIFDTKGIEYIAVIIFLLMLIPFWITLNKKSPIVIRLRSAIGTLTSGLLSIPEGLFLSKNHTWAFLEKSGVARVGMDDFVIHVLGEVSFADMHKPGENIRKGEVLARLEHNGKHVSLLSPVSGEIIKVNPVLDQFRGMRIGDPYDQGWIYQLKPSGWVAETSGYMLSESASQWLRKELDRFKEFIGSAIAPYGPEPSLVIMQDGGELRDQPMTDLPSEVWQQFQDNFLKTVS